MATRKGGTKTTRKTKTPTTPKAKSGATKKSATAASASTNARMAIDLDQLETLMQTLDRHGITELEIEKGGERIVLRRGPVAVAAAPAIVASAAPVAAPAAAAPAAPAAAPAEDPNVVFVTSPFVGTFYRASSPTAAPFVDVGSEIRKGQTLCIVEAMKLMNEIESELDGTIVEIVAENGKPVEYGDRLFKVRRR